MIAGRFSRKPQKSPRKPLKRLNRSRPLLHPHPPSSALAVSARTGQQRIFRGVIEKMKTPKASISDKTRKALSKKYPSRKHFVNSSDYAEGGRIAIQTSKTMRGKIDLLAATQGVSVSYLARLAVDQLLDYFLKNGHLPAFKDPSSIVSRPGAPRATVQRRGRQ